MRAQKAPPSLDDRDRIASLDPLPHRLSVRVLKWAFPISVQRMCMRYVPLPVGLAPTGSCQEIRDRKAAQTGTGRACRSSSRQQDTRLAAWGGDMSSS